MKKFIVLASSDNISSAEDINEIHPALEAFETQAYHAGYDVDFEGSNLQNVKLILDTTKKNMPSIDVRLDTEELDSKGIVYYDFQLTFPVLSSDDLDYGDSAEYYIQQWEDVGKFCSWMNANPIVLDRWED